MPTWIIFSLGSALIVSVSSLIEKKILNKEHTIQYSVTLTFLVGLLSLPFLFFIDYSSLSLKIVLIIFAVSVIASYAYFLVAKATKHMEISVISPLLSMAPAMTALIAFLFLGETLRAPQLSGLILIVLGSFILEKASKEKFHFHIFKKNNYVYFVFLALVLYSITASLDRYVLLSPSISPLSYLVIVQIFIAFNFFVISLIQKRPAELLSGLRQAGGQTFIIALLTTCSRFLLLNAISLAYVGLVVALKHISSLFTTILGGKLFHEKNIGEKTMACLLIVVGVIVMILL